MQIVAGAQMKAMRGCQPPQYPYPLEVALGDGVGFGVARGDVLADGCGRWVGDGLAGGRVGGTTGAFALADVAVSIGGVVPASEVPPGEVAPPDDGAARCLFRAAADGEVGGSAGDGRAELVGECVCTEAACRSDWAAGGGWWLAAVTMSWVRPAAPSSPAMIAAAASGGQ